MATRIQTPAFVGATAAPVAAPAAHAAPAAAAVAPAAAMKTASIQMALSPAIQDVKAINPALAVRISQIYFPPAGVPRNQLTVPVAPDANISDATIFEDPHDASKKYCLTHYRLEEQTATTGKEFAVRFIAKPNGWELSVSTVKAPPATAGLLELPHDVALLLRYRQRVNGQLSALSEAAFTEVSRSADGIRGVLAIDSLARREEIYHALSDSELECKLVVRKKAQVAIPVPPGPAPVPSPKPPIMMSMMIARFPPASPTAPPPPPQPLFRQTDRVFDEELPFSFDPALHRYIYEGAGAVATGGGRGLVRKQVVWNGQQYVYYQDDGAPNAFFYLPDTFKLARRPAPPHQPLMSMRFDSPDGSREKMQVSFAYCAAPVVNRDRLTSALPALKAMVPDDILKAAGGIELEPLLPDPANIKLKLSYPGADVQGGPFALRPQAAADLRAGIVDALNLSLDQFRALYDAMFSTGQLLFTGMVEFQMGGVGEQIPFQLRIADTAEPFASWTQTANGEDVSIILNNEVECALVVRHLDAVVSADDAISVKPVDAMNGAYPVQIPPSKSAEFRLPHASPPSITALDLSDVSGTPDKDTIYNLILDASTPPAFMRQITVKTFDRTFKAAADNPQNQVMSVVVDFEGGVTVELTADKLEVPNVNIPVPVANFVLGKEESQTYRYKLTVVRLSGVTPDKDWRSGESGLLFVVVS